MTMSKVCSGPTRAAARPLFGAQPDRRWLGSRSGCRSSRTVARGEVGLPDRIRRERGVLSVGYEVTPSG